MKRQLVGVFVLTAAFVAFGEPLVVDKGSTVSLQEETKTEKKYDSVTVHGTLNVLTNVLLRSYNGMVLGSAAGDNAIVNISGPRDTTGVGFTNATSGVISIGAETDGGAAQIRVAGDQVFNPPTASQFHEFYGFAKYLFAYSVQSTTILAGTAANGQDAEGNPTIDWLKLDAGGVAATRGVNNKSTAYPARILFNGGAIYNNNQWSIKYFQGQTNILESVDGNPIIIANTYANYTFNSSGTAVETRGDGDVIFVSKANAEQGAVTMYKGVVWNHAGDVCVDQNTRLSLAAADLLPHNPNGGILRIGSTPGGATQMLDVKGMSSDVNGIVAGSGYVTNSSATRATLTLGRERAEAILSGRIQGGIDLVKEGEGTLVVSNLTAESLKVTAGSIRLLGNNSIRSLTLAEDVKILMTSVETDYSQAYVPNLGAEVVVDGGHVLTARIDDEFNAPLTVLAGTTLRLVPSPCANKYWRFTFKACWGNGKVLQLTRALLVNAAGGLLYNKASAFTRDADGTAATSLAATHYAITQGFGYRSDNLDQSQYYDPKAMFVDNYYTYAQWTNSSTRVDQPDTWKQVTLRLADTASAVAGYRMGDTYWAGSASVSAWALESSADGVTWMKMDERDYSKTFAEEIASFMQANGGNYSPNAFAFTSDYKSGAFFRHAGAVSVAAGAKLDLDGIADANVTIASLSAKYGEANGTITYFSPAEEGTLYLTDVPEGADLNRLIIPFAFTRKSSDAAAKIATWTLYANGEPVRDATLILTDDGLKVKIPHGLLLLFR